MSFSLFIVLSLSFDWSNSGSITTTQTITTTSTVTLPAQCSSYIWINDVTRLLISSGGTSCDSSSPFSTTMTWFRFIGFSGTMLATTSSGPNQCGTVYTGWYSGTMPTWSSTIIGTSCFGSSAIDCQFTDTIAVSNCGSFYVYAFRTPPLCPARYYTVWTKYLQSVTKFSWFFFFWLFVNE